MIRADVHSSLHLRKHQKQVIERMLDARTNHRLLFVAGTGSGKTIASIVTALHMLRRKLVDGVHITAPKGVLNQFSAEVKRLVPPEDLPQFRLQTHQTYFLTPDTHIARNKLLIVDEAHQFSTQVERDKRGHLKNGIIAHAAMEKAQYAGAVLLLTATPMENNPTDLLNLVCMVSGKSHTAFSRDTSGFRRVMLNQSRDYIRTGFKGALSQHNEQLSLYAQLIAPYIMFAKTSREGFPRKKEVIVRLDMDPHYLGIYNSVEQSELQALRVQIQQQQQQQQQQQHLTQRRPDQPHGRTQKSKTRARMEMGTAHHTAPVSESDPTTSMFFDPESKNAFYINLRRLVNGCTENIRSRKIVFALDLVRKAHQRNERVVVYSNFLNSGLSLIRKELEMEHIPFVEYTGKCTRKHRDECMSKFNGGHTNVMLLSRAGAEGLDLKCVRHVILLEPHFHNERLRQVVGRAVRYRSHEDLPEHKRTVTVHHLLLCKPVRPGEQTWEETHQHNIETVRRLVIKYKPMTTTSTVILHANSTNTMLIHETLKAMDEPASLFQLRCDVPESDSNIRVQVTGGLALMSMSDFDCADVVSLPPPKVNLSVDDILYKLSVRKQHVIQQHLKLIRTQQRHMHMPHAEQFSTKGPTKKLG